MGKFTPCQLYDAFKSFVNMLVILTTLMFAVHALWRTVSPTFATIQPKHKQWYVVANIFNASCLAILACSYSWLVFVYRGYYLDEWHSTPLLMFYVKRSVGLYVVMDVVALYMVPKLPKTTKLFWI